MIEEQSGFIPGQTADTFKDTEAMDMIYRKINSSLNLQTK